MFNVQTGTIMLQKNDKLILTSDGVTDNLTSDEILKNSKDAMTIALAAHTRSKTQSFRSTPDDVTVFLGVI